MKRTKDWTEELKGFLRTPADLVRQGYLSVSEATAVTGTADRYRISVSPYYASLIERDALGRPNKQCPIYLQAIPTPVEDVNWAGFSKDPLNDTPFQVAPRLTHRLPGRALLHVTANCSTYCRFCFRKTLLNDSVDELFSGDLSKAIAYLHSDSTISEIILTGGDPLMLGDSQLTELIRRLRQIPYLTKLRIHTRVPVTFPSRVTSGLIRSLASDFERRVVVTHFNHPRELTPIALRACHDLMVSQILVWNQAVLLKGVNDQPAILSDLFSRIHSEGILNYYLHHPDRSAGTRHFWMSLKQGLEIFKRVPLSSSILPRYVVDSAGTQGKIPVAELLATSVNSLNSAVPAPDRRSLGESFFQREEATP